MSAVKKGWQGRVFSGTAGSTAATLLENTKDMSETKDTDKSNTTVRGQGLVPPVETESTSIRKWSFEWTMVNRASDTALEAIRTAEATGTPIALRTRDAVDGKGYDGDVNISSTHGMPLNGEQTLVFTATPNNDLREPQLYV
jgi:hypothetical protein